MSGDYNSCVEVKLTEEGLNIYKLYIAKKLSVLNDKEKFRMKIYYARILENNLLEFCLGELIQIFGWSLDENKQLFEHIKIEGQDISLEELFGIINVLTGEQRARS